MPIIPRVDALLACDDENIPKVRQLLDEFSHDLPELLNQACVLYERAQHSFGQGIGDHSQDLMQAMNTLGLSDPGKVRDVVEKRPPPGQQQVYAAENTGLDRLYSRENRGILVARMGVQYAMAVADLLRMRVTSPLSFLRLQCESIACSARDGAAAIVGSFIARSRGPQFGVECNAAWLAAQPPLAWYSSHEARTKH